MIYLASALFIAVAVLFVVSEGSYSRTRQKQWWHFRPSLPLVLGPIIGVVISGFAPAITNSAEKQMWVICCPIIGFTLGSAVGLMVDESMYGRRK
jgi:hypothetical protein